jgi:MFS family permease
MLAAGQPGCHDRRRCHHLYDQTHSPALAALVMALSFLPYLVGGVLLNAAVDRWPARRVLVGCDLSSAAMVALMVIPGIPVAGLLALVFAEGLFAPVFQGVRAALLPELLPAGSPYIRGRALIRMVAQGAQIAGAHRASRRDRAGPG